MTTSTRNKIIETIIKREKLRNISRLQRLARNPLRTLPYYVLASLSHIRPFLISFKLLWGSKIQGYIPECNTFVYYGYGEANLTNFFLRYIKSGMTCIDVGAHIGSYSMLLAELVSDSGHIYCFEPTPWTYELLRKNTMPYKNITLENLGVAQENRTVSFTDYGPGYGAYNSGNVHGTDIDNTQRGTQIKIQCTSLNDYYKKNEMSPPDIIKIDSEGFEYEVLVGCTKLLSREARKRPLLIIEVANGEKWADNRNSAFTLLEEYGYRAFEIAVDGHLSPHEIRTDYRYDNLVFIPEERVSEVTTNI